MAGLLRVSRATTAIPLSVIEAQNDGLQEQQAPRPPRQESKAVACVLATCALEQALSGSAGTQVPLSVATHSAIPNVPAVRVARVRGVDAGRHRQLLSANSAAHPRFS